EGEDGRDQHAGEDDDVPPVRQRRQRVDRVVPGGQAGGEREEREAATEAQYGGSSAHQAPSTLKAFQNAVFAGCSSSEASMSGTTSACAVGVSCCSSPSAGSTGCASGNPRPFRNASASSPIATTSFGWTICSSRTSQPLASSSAAPSANLTQFVP